MIAARLRGRLAVAAVVAVALSLTVPGLHQVATGAGGGGGRPQVDLAVRAPAVTGATAARAKHTFESHTTNGVAPVGRLHLAPAGHGDAVVELAATSGSCCAGSARTRAPPA